MAVEFPVDILISTEDYYSSIQNSKYLPLLDELELPRDVEIICVYCSNKVQIDRDHFKVIRLFEGFFEDENERPNWPLINLCCNKCKKCTAIYINNYWWKTNDILRTKNPTKQGILEVKTPGERFLLWVLNQIFLVQYEIQKNYNAVFLAAAPTEKAKLIWDKEEALGFYIWKPKGTPCVESCCVTYQLPVVDLVFIRQEFRRKGYGLQILDDIVTTFPKQDIGFSKPISESMFRVLCKFLSLHPEFQSNLWEVCFDGSLGNRNNIWLHLKKLGLTPLKKGKTTE